MKNSFFSVKRNVIITAIVYTFMWGCAFPLVKICLQSFHIADADNMSKCLVAGVRFFLSGILTLSFCLFHNKEKLSIDLSQLKIALIYGILATFMQYAFTYIGLSRVEGSKGAIFDQVCVFIIILFSGVFFKNDKLNFRKIVGCMIGFAGVVIINVGEINFDFHLNGEGLLICAALCQTAAYFIAKGSAKTMSAIKLVGYGQLIGGILLCILAYAFGGRILVINGTAVITLLMLVAISAVAYTLSLMPLKYFPASEISSFNLLITVFGVIMSAVLLNEDVIRWNYILSLMLVSLGILLINQKTERN